MLRMVGILRIFVGFLRFAAFSLRHVRSSATLHNTGSMSMRACLFPAQSDLAPDHSTHLVTLKYTITLACHSPTLRLPIADYNYPSPMSRHRTNPCPHKYPTVKLTPCLPLLARPRRTCRQTQSRGSPLRISHMIKSSTLPSHADSFRIMYTYALYIYYI